MRSLFAPRFRTATALLLALMVSAPAFAADPNAEAVRKAFCPALNDEAAYKEHKMTNYVKLIPGKDGRVFRSTTAFKNDFQVEPLTVDLLKDFTAKLKQKGTDLVIVYPPTQGGVVHSDALLPETLPSKDFNPALAKENYIKSIKAMQAAGLNVVGLPEGEITKAKDFFYKRDHHWNSTGARIMAQQTAAVMKALPAYKSIPRVKFTSEDKGEVDYLGGSFGKAFEKICGTSLPSEKTHKFVTVQADTASSEAALLGDAPMPEIVLTGTSNSTWEPSFSNFEGFLKEYAESDIMNQAISGAGIDASVIGYLNSKEFKAKPPKILIWEIPGYYDLNQSAAHSVFLQGLAAAQGGCGKDVLSSTSPLPITGEKMELFTGLQSKNIKGGKALVSFTFQETPKSPFVMEFWDGKVSKKVRIERDKRYPVQNDSFMVIVNRDLPGVLDKVVLKTTEKFSKKQRVTAQLCSVPEK